MARVSDLLAAGRTYSFEFFPPKTDGAQLSLGRTIAELEPLAPSFVSVTYGAGGSTRARTREVVTLGPPRDLDHADGPPHLPGPHPGRDRRDPRRLPGRRHREHPRPRRRSARATRRTRRATTATPSTCSTTSRARATSRSAWPPIPRCIPAPRIGRPTAGCSPPSCRGRLRDHPVLLRGPPLLAPRRRARRARRRQAGAAGDHADHQRRPGPPDGRAQRRRAAGVARRRGSTASTTQTRSAGSASSVASALCAELLERRRTGAAPLHAQPQHGEPRDLRQPRARRASPRSEWAVAETRPTRPLEWNPPRRRSAACRTCPGWTACGRSPWSR